MGNAGLASDCQDIAPVGSHLEKHAKATSIDRPFSGDVRWFYSGNLGRAKTASNSFGPSISTIVPDVKSPSIARKGVCRATALVVWMLWTLAPFAWAQTSQYLGKSVLVQRGARRSVTRRSYEATMDCWKSPYISSIRPPW